MRLRFTAEMMDDNGERVSMPIEVETAVPNPELDSGKFVAIGNDKRAWKSCGKRRKTSAKVGNKKNYAAFEVVSDSAGF